MLSSQPTISIIKKIMYCNLRLYYQYYLLHHCYYNYHYSYTNKQPYSKYIIANSYALIFDWLY